MFQFRARRHSPYNNINEFALLETMEQDMWERYETEPSYKIKEQLFYLNLRMWELEPEKEYYRNTITKLVLELGWDLKRRKINYEQAQMFFEDLIKLAKPRALPIAHYRLGFIDFYNKKYRSAIRHFEHALQPPVMEDRRPLPHETLNESQSMKAQAQLAIALARYSVETALKAKQMYEELGSPDDVDIDYVTGLEQEILKEEPKPYMIFTPSGRQSITEREYKDLRNDETAFIFDCTDHDEKRLIVRGRTGVLSPRRMVILEELFVKMKPVPQKELADKLNMPQVSRYMGDLRKDLLEYGMDETTIVADNGYRINHPKPMLIYNAHDPKYMM